MPPKKAKTSKPATKKAGQKPFNSDVAHRQSGWPALEPLVSKEDLSLYHLVPNQIVTISNFWTANLCKKYVIFLMSLPLTTTSGTPKRGEAVRVNDRFQVDDPAFAEMLWSQTALKDLVLKYGTDDDRIDDKVKLERQRELWDGEVLGLNPNIRIYRYRRGQFFDQHYDESNSLIHQPSSTPARTTWTLLLYLTSSSTGCHGGETVFYPEPSTSKNAKKSAEEHVVVGLETGMALLHRHGHKCMLHEGREVLEGEKWVIRSDLCVRR